ncbi:hypothetical protein M885DRAFT_530492 [Pelagophyceae sp. CCMP2097]|nr:hypothetical protein M885DRAFT_530492 [Pelagophyceae sp. CCMP2097]|mmetsp:Transcript_25980/g.89347  ORF Transcript_25980/g.89347 Transcript_25980/m.89347 type:complete len:330 (+) Transcript_25980:183-1172(+)
MDSLAARNLQVMATVASMLDFDSRERDLEDADDVAAAAAKRREHDADSTRRDGGKRLAELPDAAARAEFLRVQAFDAKRPRLTRSETTDRRYLGSLGGYLAGTLGDNRFVAQYATDGRSKCRDTKCAAKHILANELRLGKVPPSLHKLDAPKTKTQWYHTRCLFRSFSRMHPNTKTVASTACIDGFDSLQQQDQILVRDCVAHFVATAAELAKPMQPFVPKRQKAQATDRALSAAATAALLEIKRQKVFDEKHGEKHGEQDDATEAGGARGAASAAPGAGAPQSSPRGAAADDHAAFHRIAFDAPAPGAAAAVQADPRGGTASPPRDGR